MPIDFVPTNHHLVAAALLASAIRQPADDRSDKSLVDATKRLLVEMRDQKLIELDDREDNLP